jgi:hypothetical protein
MIFLNDDDAKKRNAKKPKLIDKNETAAQRPDGDPNDPI